MNDFTELENELKDLRPSPASPGLLSRIEQTMADLPGESDLAGKIVHPTRFKVSWLSLGIGLAAAAVFLIFARIDGDRPSKQTTRVARNTPVPATTTPPLASAEFIPTGATQVVFNTRDEGLHYADGYERPLRRMRYQKRETLRWRNPQTGASLRVSYPTEEVVLTPVIGQ